MIWLPVIIAVWPPAPLEVPERADELVTACALDDAEEETCPPW